MRNDYIGDKFSYISDNTDLALDSDMWNTRNKYNIKKEEWCTSLNLRSRLLDPINCLEKTTIALCAVDPRATPIQMPIKCTQCLNDNVIASQSWVQSEINPGQIERSECCTTCMDFPRDIHEKKETFALVEPCISSAPENFFFYHKKITGFFCDCPEKDANGDCTKKTFDTLFYLCSRKSNKITLHSNDFPWDKDNCNAVVGFLGYQRIIACAERKDAKISWYRKKSKQVVKNYTRNCAPLVHYYDPHSRRNRIWSSSLIKDLILCVE